jgi:preprotein translocase subunit SecF
MRIFGNANYPFLHWRRYAYVATGVLLLVGFLAMARNVVDVGSWQRYGVDFQGGTLVQLEFQRAVTVDEIRSAARAGGHADWEITRFGQAHEYVVRMPTFEESLERTPEQLVQAALISGFQPGEYRVVRTEAVGPKVGAELQVRALIAILLSFVATLIYVAVRFEWRFGVAAVVATGHDILVTLGFLALLQTEIVLGTVAAFLTIVGYSLNDTIVVFDRVRENLGKPRHGRSFMEILNTSINETLPRTVLTSGTTLLTLLSLYLFGGAVIRDFALVLILGVLVGTYSSIFVASPMLHWIEGRWPHKPKKKPVVARSESRSRAASPA